MSTPGSESGALPVGLPDLLREHVAAAAEEMEQSIRGQIPEYARVPGSFHEQWIQKTIAITVTHFVDSVGGPEPDATPLIDHYTQIGAHEAREGRSLDDLQTAMRLSGQVACRRFIKDAYRYQWPRDTLGLLTDSLFALLSRVADAAAQGYAREQGRLATDADRRRARLRDLIVGEPPASAEAIAELAKAAGWALPGTIALLALPPGEAPDQWILPPAVLADWDDDAPFLVVPDPLRPGHRAYLAGLARERTAAVGPPVPVARGAVSLHWARRAIDLIERGILPGGGVVQCLDHVATLAGSAAEDLIDAAAETGLAELRALPPHRRLPLLETLLVYLQYGNNAVAAASRLQIHEQTVRYRLRRIAEITGGRLPGGDSHLDTMIMLNWLLRSTVQ